MRKTSMTLLLVFGSLILMLLIIKTLSGKRALIGDYHYDLFLKEQAIEKALMRFSVEHGGKYPDGSNSTEVFQKLIDLNYIKDPDTFYFEMADKSRPEKNHTIKSTNVCFDLTGGVEQDDPDNLPLVFMTGFKVTYREGASAVSLQRPYPGYFKRAWWNLTSLSPEFYQFQDPGVFVVYKNGKFQLLPLILSGSDFGIIPNFIPKKCYIRDGKLHQLVPSGRLN